MSFSDIAQLTLDACASALATDAVYMPPGGGESIACRVIVDQPDEMLDTGQGRALTRARTLEVRAAEVPQPAKGGTFVIGGETLTVLDDPQFRDAERLAFIMRVR